MIPFNKPYLSGKECSYIEEAVKSGKISGDGIFSKKCHEFFEKRYGFKKCLLTTSCTDALEMAAILLNLQPEDEIIVPSYTFVSSANAFVLRGARIVFADSKADNPNIDENTIEDLVSSKTKAIVVVHYAGIACNMEKIMEVAIKHHLYVIEDAAQAIDSYYTFKDGSKKWLGSIGHLSAFSFHETKNIISGEGGMLAINDPVFFERAEVIREKGTNRTAFFRGDIEKYNWIDIGSSFLPSEIVAAFLWAQLEKIESIQESRKAIWNKYYDSLKNWAGSQNVKLPNIPTYAVNNGHLFYIVCRSSNHRYEIIEALKKENIMAVSHYLSLHKSPFYKDRHDGRELYNADRFSDCLLRLPLYFELSTGDVERISSIIKRDAD